MMDEVVAPAHPPQLKHVLIREYVRELLSGAAPGTSAPSERELVARFGVARMTVRQALEALVAEGVLRRIPGRGTFVAELKPETCTPLAGYTEELVKRGLKPSSKTVLARMEFAGPGVARALQIKEGAGVVHWQRLRFADGEPICVEDAYLADSIVPALLDEPLPDSLYAELQRRDLMPTWAEDSVVAGLASHDEARLLVVGKGEPVLRVSRRAFAGSIVVEVSRSVFRADRYTMRVRLARPSVSAPA